MASAPRIPYTGTMLILLAPSKTMDFTTPIVTPHTPTRPVFQAEAETVMATLKKLPQAKLRRLYQVSDTLVRHTMLTHDVWGNPARPAVFAYVGDVYRGFFAHSLGVEDLAWAQSHLLILTGLYGGVRPLDLVSRYRLEMKAQVPVKKARNLYQFWDRKVADWAIRQADGVILNLASDEYARVVTAHLPPDIRLITPLFMDTKPDGTQGVVPIYSKMMRGVMARWLIDERVTDPDRLNGFQGQQYHYSAAHSQQDKPAFLRAIPMTPLRFTDPRG